MSLSGNLSIVYSFVNTPGPGTPISGLCLADDGNFYGASVGGGANSDGSIFRLIPSPTSVKVLFSFDEGEDGATPADALIQGSDGNFYGTAFQGGLYGFGSIFQMTPEGNLTPLYGFYGADDGGNPYAGLIQGIDGYFYGTTLQFGANGLGTVFQVGTDGTFNTLISFNGTNGAFPQGGVVQGPDGLLYGTTFTGGTNGFGTVFSLTTNGAINTLFSFNSTNGSSPAASLMQGSDGNFYGTTSAGGAGGQGTVFRITTNGTLTTLLWFDGLNGADPESPLIQATDGNIYGTTAQGGTGFNPSAGGGNGAMFKITVPIFVTNTITAPPAVPSLYYIFRIPGFTIAPQSDTLAFAKVSGPAWLNVTPRGAIHGISSESDIGTNSCVISLTDSNGFTATATVIIPVTQEPPPIFLNDPFAEPWANVNMPYSAMITTNVTNPQTNDGNPCTTPKPAAPRGSASRITARFRERRRKRMPG